MEILPKKGFLIAELVADSKSKIIVEGKSSKKLLVHRWSEELEYKKGQNLFIKGEAKLYPLKTDKGEFYVIADEDVVAYE